MKQKNLKKKKTQRNNDATEIISGVNPIYEILQSESREVRRLWVAHKQIAGSVETIINIAKQRGVQVIKTSREELEKLTRMEKHQGIAAEVTEFAYSDIEDILKNGENDPKGHFILVLDNILDPQNLGSIIRTAHLLGVHGVIIPERNSASIGPASTRASAGAVEYIPIARVTNIFRTLELLKEKGVWVVGAEVGGDDLYSYVFSGSCAIVVGSEGKGIRRLVKEGCDKILSIPAQPLSEGSVNSYNVAAATAIIVSEAARQRRL